MKNYLKKAISAVIALALAASMVPATLAANVVLTDVPETASYATAVNALVALGVVDGYEDNTFLPDNKITRAEVSKIIVASLNETAAAEAMKGATKFADIEAKHEWATGYINKGVSMGYINGMDGGFNPDGNVTYAQVVKMMLVAMGYGDYASSIAEQNGYTGANWYRAYTDLAQDAGITDGVYAGPNEDLTRAQVAQLVFNAIQAPVVKSVSVTYTDSGKIVPKIQIQDGEQSTYFKSILTEKFDAYYVEGYVTETQKDNTGLKANEVKFGIAKSKKYAEDDVRFTTTIADYATVVGTPARVLQKVYVGDTDAANYKATYATAIIALDEYDDWTLLDFTPSGKNKTYTFDLKDLDDEAYENASGVLTQSLWTAIQTSSAPYLKFFVDGASTSTKYLLDATVGVYVNGVKVTTGDPIWDYVIKGDVGDVELVDTYKTNGKIDAIYVNSYVSGMVDGISSNGKITLAGADHGIYSLTLDDEDATLEYHIFYNGEEISINDLKEDDVLTISYNVTAATTQKNAFAASKFYEIYVSRDVVTETLKGKNADDYEAKFGDTYYPFATSAKYSSFASAAKLGDEYTVYLDAFGRIFKTEINSSAANWGVAEKFTKATSDDDYKLTVFTADGTTKTYFFDASKASVTKLDGKVINKSTDAAGKVAGESGFGTALGESGLESAVQGLVYTTPTSVKSAVSNRVIQYKVSTSSGKITELKFIASTVDTATTAVEFKARNNTIGAIKMGDATKIVDATKYVADKDLFAASLSTLTDEVKYKAYAYGTKIDGVYPFVLVTEGESAYNAKTRFAVVTKAGYQEEADPTTGDTVYSVAALYGEATEIIFSDEIGTGNSAGQLGALNAGDVIYFKTDSNGLAKEYNVLFSVGSSIPSQATLAANSLKNNNKTYTNLTNIAIESTFGGNFSTDFTVNWTAPSADSIQLIYGPVIDRDDSYVTFAAIDASGKTNTLNAAEAVEFEFANEVNVYTYDYSLGKDSRFGYSTAKSAVVPSNILESNMGNMVDHDSNTSTPDVFVQDGVTIDWNYTVDGAKVNQESVNFAFAVVAEDEIVDIFTFIAK